MCIPAGHFCLKEKEKLSSKIFSPYGYEMAKWCIRKFWGLCWRFVLFNFFLRLIINTSVALKQHASRKYIRSDTSEAKNITKRATLSVGIVNRSSNYVIYCVWLCTLKWQKKANLHASDGSWVVPGDRGGEIHWLQAGGTLLDLKMQRPVNHDFFCDHLIIFSKFSLL